MPNQTDSPDGIPRVETDKPSPTLVKTWDNKGGAKSDEGTRAPQVEPDADSAAPRTAED